MDCSFFFTLLLFYSCILNFFTYCSSNILFIMPIIPSLNTVHRTSNRFLLYRQPHKLYKYIITMNDDYTVTQLIIEYSPQEMITAGINVFIGSRCLWDKTTCTPRLNANCCQVQSTKLGPIILFFIRIFNLLFANNSRFFLVPIILKIMLA